MAQAVINFKTDAKLKSEAKAVLDKMGLNFSIAFNAYLRKLTAEKRIEFTVPEVPNARLRKAIREAEEEYKLGKTAGPFSTIKEMRKSLGV
jgi:addiction module RelB/DinJ family antitoxin